MNREEFIAAVSRLLAGLQVPVSMEMPLGGMGGTWAELHRGLIGFGWATAENYEEKIREVLGS